MSEDSKMSHEDISKPWLTLGQRIKGYNVELSNRFSARDSKGMADLVLDTEILVKPNGDMLRGKEIGEFWKELSESRGVEDLTFRTVNVHMTPIKEENKDNYDYVAYEVVEYSYIDAGKETGGSFVRAMRHMHHCPWPTMGKVIK